MDGPRVSNTSCPHRHVTNPGRSWSSSHVLSRGFSTTTSRTGLPAAPPRRGAGGGRPRTFASEPQSFVLIATPTPGRTRLTFLYPSRAVAAPIASSCLRSRRRWRFPRPLPVVSYFGVLVESVDPSPLTCGRERRLSDSSGGPLGTPQQRAATPRRDRLAAWPAATQFATGVRRRMPPPRGSAMGDRSAFSCLARRSFLQLSVAGAAPSRGGFRRRAADGVQAALRHRSCTFSSPTFASFHRRSPARIASRSAPRAGMVFLEHGAFSPSRSTPALRLQRPLCSRRRRQGPGAGPVLEAPCPREAVRRRARRRRRLTSTACRAASCTFLALFPLPGGYPRSPAGIESPHLL